MAKRLSVFIYANDPVTQTGIASGLRGRPEVQLVSEADLGDAAVAVIASDIVDDETVQTIRSVQRQSGARVVLVVARPDEAGLLAAVEAGVSGLLRRAEATPESLTRAIRAASAGDGALPPDLLGRLLTAVGRLHEQVLDPRRLSLAVLNQREVEVLRLVAEGLGTTEIATHLAYSERTIKNILHDVTIRLNLRNRTHAVAYALRQGLI